MKPMTNVVAQGVEYVIVPEMRNGMLVWRRCHAK